MVREDYSRSLKEEQELASVGRRRKEEGRKSILARGNSMDKTLGQEEKFGHLRDRKKAYVTRRWRTRGKKVHDKAKEELGARALRPP